SIGSVVHKIEIKKEDQYKSRSLGMSRKNIKIAVKISPKIFKQVPSNIQYFSGKERINKAGNNG
ncbi:hypothetical protein, partial [Parvimonas sp. D9]|uniref:hypothetical protein n=1 Tax=Parvimonas sp. D9 TaxID=3110689 RepID=UPI002B45EB95